MVKNENVLIRFQLWSVQCLECLEASCSHNVSDFFIIFIYTTNITYL